MMKHLNDLKNEADSFIALKYYNQIISMRKLLMIGKKKS